MPDRPKPLTEGGKPYWRTTTPERMSLEEWEALCDGCGKCCLHKLEDEDSGEVAYTEVACRMLDCATCRCSRYEERTFLVPDCVELTADNLAALRWLPTTCAYRLVAEGRDLPWWHPLVSGDPDTVHQAGISARGRVIPERQAGDLEDHIVDWPQ